MGIDRMNWDKLILKSTISILFVGSSSIGFAQMIGSGFYNKSSVEGFASNDWYINYRRFINFETSNLITTTTPMHSIIDSNKATLTNELQHETSCIYNKKKFFIQNGFKVSFSYSAKKVNAGEIADGAAFVMQSQGSQAMGATGGNLGFFNYSTELPGISDGVALALNLYNSSNLSDKKNVGFKFAKSQFDIQYATDVNGPFDFEDYPLLKTGNEIQVKMDYDRSTKKIRVELQQSGVPTTIKIKDYAGIEISSLVGNKSVWVGFCGANGGLTSTQVISNFKFTSF